MKKSLSKNVNLIGNRYGNLVVIDFVEILANGSCVWKCKCDCGNETEVTAGNLYNGEVTHCGCKTINVPEDESLVGNKYNMLTVVSAVNERKRSGRIWKCQCDCGNIAYVSAHNLTTGHTKSCGCRVHKSKTVDYDMIGLRSGRLVVVERGEDYISNQGSVFSRWKCKCDCGNETLSYGSALRHGRVKSCGCLRREHMNVKRRKPFAEKWIYDFLKKKCLAFEDQKTFDDLVGVNGGLLQYDFYIESYDGRKLVIECNGEQHFRPIEFFGGKKSFDKQRAHDNLKMKYAFDNNIDVLHINYVHAKKEEVLDLLDSKLKMFL